MRYNKLFIFIFTNASNIKHSNLYRFHYKCFIKIYNTTTANIYIQYISIHIHAFLPWPCRVNQNNVNRTCNYYNSTDVKDILVNTIRLLMEKISFAFSYNILTLAVLVGVAKEEGLRIGLEEWNFEGKEITKSISNLLCIRVKIDLFNFNAPFSGPSFLSEHNYFYYRTASTTFFSICRFFLSKLYSRVILSLITI